MKQTNFQSYASQKPTLENSVHYIAHTFSFLATSKDTGGAFSLIHCYFRKGFTPPPHYHKLEEESFFILEGEIDFHIGDTKTKVGPGELIILPRNVPHSFNLITETAKALILITPGGFEVFFEEFGQPAKTLDLPPIPTTNPRQEIFDAMHARMIELGSVFMPGV
jgi:quercetin dioxygenase-like cupin family protein